MSFRIGFFCILMVLMNVALPVKSYCLENNRKKKYIMLYPRENPEEAAEYCQSHGYQLPAIESEEEFQNINNFLKTYNRFWTFNRYWTSGHRLSDRNIWGSTDEVILSGLWWGLPSQEGGSYDDSQNCIEIAEASHFSRNNIETTDPKFVLNFIDCSLERTTICEKYIQEEDGSEVASYCLKNSRKKEYYFPAEPVNFTDAVEYCRQRQGWQLAAIESQEEYLAISEKLKQRLGGIEYRYWTSGNDLSGIYKWESTDQSIDLKAPWWLIGEPSKTFEGVEEHCVEIAGNIHFFGRGVRDPEFVLNDEDCSKKRWPLCEKYIQDEENIEDEYVGPEDFD